MKIASLLSLFVCMLSTSLENLNSKQELPHKAFYFVRHGITEWNVLTKQQGQADIPLNDTGRKQVKDLSELCNSLPITHFCSSTLCRASETMQILNNARTVKLPEYCYDDLKEQGKGKLEGITQKEWELIPRAEINAQMENKDLFQKRTLRVMCEILSKPGTPCIIAHSNNLRCIGKLTGCSINAIPHDTIWLFEPPSADSTTWKMAEYKP